MSSSWKIGKYSHRSCSFVLGNAHKDPRAFSVGGDSGSWVVDQWGNFVGIVLGGNEDVRPVRCHISDTRFLLYEVEKVIGLMPEVCAFEEEKPRDMP
jgi:hypothetical protein